MTTNNNMSVEQLLARIAELEAAKKKPQSGLKVSAKGAISLYGINSTYPVTLYKTQWEAVLAKADEIRAFMVANESALSTKPVKVKKETK